MGGWRVRVPAARQAAGTLLERMLPSAIGSLAEIERALSRREPAVFLDYDGTLTPIVERPELALLGESMRETVRRLGQCCPVAVVSGRDRADVERLVALDSIVYAGSHGFDIAGPGGLSMQHEDGTRFAQSLRDAAAALRARLDDVAGVLIELKRYALAIHYRLAADDDVPRVQDAVSRTATAFPDLRTTGGKKLLELRPQIDWDKGKAVLWLLDALHLDREEVLPLYLGDDVTDEDAFAALADRGIGIVVGAPTIESRASYRLADVAEVERFLAALIELVEQRR